jgi:hypothetical protein
MHAVDWIHNVLEETWAFQLRAEVLDVASQHDLGHNAMIGCTEKS